MPWQSSRNAGFSLCLLTIILLVEPASAAVRHVDGNATGPTHDGTSWCRAFTTLQDALSIAGPGDEIRVANGVYRPDQGGGQTAGNRQATFRLRDRVQLRGGYAGCGAANPDARNVAIFETILSGDLSGNDGADFANYGDNSYHVVTYEDPNATAAILDGFTVASGNADGTGVGVTNQGGGIHIRQGSQKCIPGGPTIRNCIVEKNWGAHHGAINDHGLATVIENCIIRNNFAGMEGGGLQVHSGSPRVTDTAFLNNISAGEGGGAWLGSDDDVTCTGVGRAEFVGCTFDGNQAPRGGGIFNDGSSPTFESCTWQHNRAVKSQDTQLSGFAGGMYNLAGVDVSIRDCTFLRNDSELYAGAIYNESSSPDIIGCDFIENQLDTNDFTFVGGILNFLDSSPWIENCRFEGNTAYSTAAVLNDVNCFPIFNRCVFEGNFAANGPGTMFNANWSDPLIVNSIFRSNTGTYGGAIHNSRSASATIVNSLFAGNVALISGGALSAFDAEIGLLVNSTLYGNTAQQTGGGVLLDNGGLGQIRNSILWNNADSGGIHEAAQISVLAGSLTISHTCVQGWTGLLGGAGNIGADPLFVDADGPDGIAGTNDDDLHLLFGSPVVNLGGNFALPNDLTDLDGDGDTTEPVPLDLDGRPRAVAGIVDLGAYELADCNGNGIDDLDDVTGGTSDDCDNNTTPDECQDDCNRNDIADACELDTDGDGVINGCDGCPNDSAKTEPGFCGCGESDSDSDSDTVPDCKDACPGFDDRLDADGDRIPDDCDPCPGYDDRLDCNNNDVADGCDIVAGTSDDLDGNGVPDECDLQPILVGDGCRSIAITPRPGVESIALRITLPQFPCLTKFARPDGFLSNVPWWQTPEEWGTVHARGSDVIPATVYAVQTQFSDGSLTPELEITTAPWGDTTHGLFDGAWTPPDGRVDIIDALAALSCFQHLPNAPPMQWCDIQPAFPDGRIDILEVVYILEGFAAIPYPFDGPSCP